LVDWVELCFSEFLFVGIMNKIEIDMTWAVTPPSLFEIDRIIEFANRKYHSGWICAGVTRGFAGVKLSGSLKTYGSFRANIVYCKYKI